MSDESNELLEEEEQKPPYVIRKVVKNSIETHGGSWKVAYADFATAMMAFFLLMWVLGATSKEEKQAISKYFIDPGGAIIGEGGANKAVIDMKAPLVIERGDELPQPTEMNEADEDLISKDKLTALYITEHCFNQQISSLFI